MNFINFLGQPYPFYENSRQALKIAFYISVFIGGFCLIFQPFGLNNIAEDVKYIGIAGYAISTFFVCSIIMVLIPKAIPHLFKAKNWKVFKEIIWIVFLTLSISTANFYYSGLFFDLKDSLLNTYLYVITRTFVIAIIPAIGVVFFKQIFLYKKIIVKSNIADTSLNKNDFIFKSDNYIVLYAENNKESFHVNLQELIYVTSSGNYVEIVYEVDGQIKRKLLRNRIIKIEESFSGSKEIIKCHRSFLVMLLKLSKQRGIHKAISLQWLV